MVDAIARTSNTLAQVPLNTPQAPVIAPTSGTQEPLKTPSLDELRKAASPVLQELAKAVGLRASAPTTPQDQVALATDIKVKLDADIAKAQKSGDPEAMRVASTAKAEFIGALVQAGGGRLNFGIPGVTSSGEVPLTSRTTPTSPNQSAVPKVEASLQQSVDKVLGQVESLEKELKQLQPADVTPAKAAEIGQRASTLLDQLRPLDRRLSVAEAKSSAISDAAAAVSVAISNLEGYVKQAQSVK